MGKKRPAMILRLSDNLYDWLQAEAYRQGQPNVHELIVGWLEFVQDFVENGADEDLIEALTEEGAEYLEALDGSEAFILSKDAPPHRLAFLRLMVELTPGWTWAEGSKEVVARRLPDGETEAE